MMSTTTATAKFVTIVSGLPRSGTSMMMRMLEMGGMPVLIDHVREADEDNPNGYYEFEAVKQTKQDPSWLENSTGKAVKMVYRLLYDLPNQYSYRIIFMRRNLEELLLSQRTMLKRNGSLEQLDDERQIEVLFRRDLKSFDEWVRKQPHMKIIDVDYNRIQHDPSTELTRVCEFLDGAVDLEAMVRVVDSSLYRNRV
jgi:hypothetical protein